MDKTHYILILAAAYLIGSIPFGVLFARSCGIDLRQVGSGNIGATNLGRAMGRKWGILCLVLDALKGFVPVLYAKTLLPDAVDTVGLLMWITIGCAAVLGHVFPIYLGFKGGKGVATSMGMVLGIWPYLTIPGLLSFAVWLTALAIWRYVSLSSILAAIALPLLLWAGIIVRADWQIANLWPLAVITALMALLVVYRHKENIKRIAAGTENSILKSKQQEKP